MNYAPDTPPPLERAPYPSNPGPLRGLGVMLGIALLVFILANRVETGADEMVGKLGRIEVTARLLDRPEQFPQLGAYRYTYVLRYQVLKVHRRDPAGKFHIQPEQEIFIGHYKPWLPRSEIKDADWGASPLGGKLDRFEIGDAHRLAIDYELADIAPSGALDYCFPPVTNRFFALWANPTSF